MLFRSYHDFKKAIIKRNIKNSIFKALGQYFRFIKWHLNNRLFSHGFAIGFTGPDGSGKTTVITGLIKVLNQIQRNVPLFHFRPTVLGNMGDVAHGVGLKKEAKSRGRALRLLPAQQFFTRSPRVITVWDSYTCALSSLTC